MQLELLLPFLLFLLCQAFEQQPKGVCPCSAVEKCVCAAQRLSARTRHECYNKPSCAVLLSNMVKDVTNCFNRAELSDKRRKLQERQCLYRSGAFCTNDRTNCADTNSNSPELKAYVQAHHSSDRGDDRIFESLSAPFARYKRCVRQCLYPSSPNRQTRLIWAQFSRKSADINELTNSSARPSELLPFSCSDESSGCVYMNATSQQLANSQCHIDSSMERQWRCKCLLKALRLPDSIVNCTSFKRPFNRIRYKDTPRLLPFDSVDFPES